MGEKDTVKEDERSTGRNRKRWSTVQSVKAQDRASKSEETRGVVRDKKWKSRPSVELAIHKVPTLLSAFHYVKFVYTV